MNKLFLKEKQKTKSTTNTKNLWEYGEHMEHVGHVEHEEHLGQWENATPMSRMQEKILGDKEEISIEE